MSGSLGVLDAGLRDEDRPTATEPGLVIVGTSTELATVPERFCGLPLDLIIALAEAYRKRAIES